MSEIFSAAGQVAAASIQANAIKDATRKQVDALERQRQFVYSELEPGKVNANASAADVERAKNKLALQAITDPALLKARYAAQEKLLEQTQGIGQGGADTVAAEAAKEALASGGDLDALKKKLIDNAMTEIDAGATIPPDLQQELVKAGLEKSGMVSGSASPKGFGGTISRQLLGSAGLALKQQRQETAQKLATTAQNLSTARANVLSSLFPSLKQTQLANQQAAQSAFQTANAATPEAGLSGTDIANLWMARVGATNQLAQKSADAQAAGGLARAQTLGGIVGGATDLGASLINNYQDYQNSQNKKQADVAASLLNV